jgi:hypothetical protein
MSNFSLLRVKRNIQQEKYARALPPPEKLLKLTPAAPAAYLNAMNRSGEVWRI